MAITHSLNALIKTLLPNKEKRKSNIKQERKVIIILINDNKVVFVMILIKASFLFDRPIPSFSEKFLKTVLNFDRNKYVMAVMKQTLNIHKVTAHVTQETVFGILRFPVMINKKIMEEIINAMTKTAKVRVFNAKSV